MDSNYISQTTLDQMVSNDQAQMLKAAVPYLPPAGQQIVSVFTKFQELSNALSLFSPANQSVRICAAENTNPMEMLDDIRRFSYGETRQKLDQMVNIMAMVQMIKIMNETP